MVLISILVVLEKKEVKKVCFFESKCSDETLGFKISFFYRQNPIYHTNHALSEQIYEQ
jgi:hypothetical protein